MAHRTSNCCGYPTGFAPTTSPTGTNQVHGVRRAACYGESAQRVPVPRSGRAIRLRVRVVRVRAATTHQASVERRACMRRRRPSSLPQRWRKSCWHFLGGSIKAQMRFQKNHGTSIGRRPWSLDRLPCQVCCYSLLYCCSRASGSFTVFSRSLGSGQLFHEAPKVCERGRYRTCVDGHA